MEEQRASLLGKPLRVMLGIALVAGVLWFVVAIRGILAPFVLAFVLAYVLDPLVDHLEGRGVHRTVSILLVFLVAFGLLGIGVFKVGGTVTDEMLDLSDRFLRKEMVERELMLRNTGPVPIGLRVEWQDGGPEQPFSLVDRTSAEVEVQPGTREAVVLRFAPEDAEPARNVLIISGPALPAPVKVRARGNMPTGHHEGPEDSWPEAEEADEIQAEYLTVSTGGVDFGKAGPNLITDLSRRAESLRPFVEPYLGEDFDPGQLIQTQGRSLVDGRLLGGTTELLGGVFFGLTFVILVPFIAFFFLKEGGRLTHDLIELVPNAYFELSLNLLHQISGQIGGYIRGQLLATSVVASLSVSGLLLIGMPYALPLGMLAGFANMIPFLGPVIGIVSASIVALAMQGGVALVGKVVLVFLCVQIIDNVLVQPTVLARSVEMHPLLVLFAVMVGSQLLGIAGMLIAVPVFGILKVSTQTVYQGIKHYRMQ